MAEDIRMERSAIVHIRVTERKLEPPYARRLAIDAANIRSMIDYVKPGPKNERQDDSGTAIVLRTSS